MATTVHDRDDDLPVVFTRFSLSRHHGFFGMFNVDGRAVGCGACLGKYAAGRKTGNQDD